MGMKPRPGRPTVRIDGREFDKRDLVDEVEEALERVLEERLEKGGDFATYEKTLLEITHEIVRSKLEKKLQGISDQLATRLWIDHDNPAWPLDETGTKFQYRAHAAGTVSYHSLVGSLRVRRYTYRQCTQMRGVCVPLELEAGLMERMTPGLAKSVAIGSAHMPSRQYEELMVASGLRPPSRSTLDRVARDLGSYSAIVHDDIEPLVRANEIINPDARSIALGLDRTAVPMRSGEPVTQLWEQSPEMYTTRPKPSPRAQIKGPVQWRMDYVGTVTLLNDEGRPLVTRKYRLHADADGSEIVQRMMADLRHALRQRPLRVAVVQDGAPQLWTLLTNALRQEPLVDDWTEVLDWYHLDERLSKCLDLCIPARSRNSQRARWHAQLLETNTGIKQVVRSLRRHKRKLDGDEEQALQGHINYFLRHKHRTKYASYRRTHTPIGSGITEGACKSVIGARAKRSGQRWSQRGLTAALHFRSVHQSERFDSFWSFFTRYYRARAIMPTIGARA